MNDSKYKDLFIKESKERLEDISHLLIDLEKGEMPPNIINNLLREFHSIKGMATAMGLKDVSRLSHGLETLLHPYRNEVGSGRKDCPFISKETIDLLIEGEEGLESMIHSIEEGNDIYQQDYTPLVERLEGFIPSLTPPSKGKGEGLKDINRRDVERENSKRLRLPPTIKVNAETLDGYINLIGELITSRSRLMGLSRDPVNYQFKEDIHTIGLLLKELYQQILTVRLLPFDNIGLGLTKLVRDLSKEKDKEVEFSIKGGSVKLDRAIFERSIEPLVHILRNSVDHGIERPEERGTLGKPQKGRIEIKVNREKEGVVIEVSDDGRGIDPLKVKDRAISMGLLTRHKADRLSREEILFLTSLPGFTTLDNITQVSGRGVGMDVVKAFVDEVGGSLKINSEPGKGTNITMTLPLTTSILETLLVSIYPDLFAIPLLRVEKVIELTRDEIKKGDRFYYFSIGKRDVPILSLRKVLKMPPSLKKSKTIYLVLINLEGKEIGLIVDGLIGEREIYVKPFKTPLDRIKGISGYTLINEGSPVFLLDLNNLLGKFLVFYLL